MTLVRDFFGHKAKPGDIGMELEVESAAPMTPLRSNIWLSKEDNSLRNHGTEFYTRNPINYDHNFFYRIQELTQHVKLPGHRTDEKSTRTSFHVHINVCEHTVLQMWNQVFLYWLMEGPLMALCGASRCGNQFCLRCKDAELQIGAVTKLLDGPKEVGSFNSDNLRYASQNLKALHQFGSLEYRGMHGYPDPEAMRDWAYGMYSLGQTAKLYKNPSEIFTLFDKSEHRDFILSNLTPTLSAQVLKVDGYSRMLSEGFDMLFDLAYDTDWKRVEDDYAKAVEDRSNRMKVKTIGFWDGPVLVNAEAPDVARAPRVRNPAQDAAIAARVNRWVANG